MFVVQAKIQKQFSSEPSTYVVLSMLIWTTTASNPSEGKTF